MQILSKNQLQILQKIEINATEQNWTDWHWQLKNSIRTIEQFEHLTGIRFSAEEREELSETLDQFPLAITPYYLSLIDRKNFANDPVYKQAFADRRELIVSRFEQRDPLSEEKDSPVEGITHRYPDRVLFHVSNICAMYCRHCTRKRKVGDLDYIPSKA
ncbi:MAG: lysine 2,3-aminomutase, partial [Prolixibacteraceae bacterium]|nr:lysine 2,3-aminomutase [Prolixibacteraceae bacterium]